MHATCLRTTSNSRRSSLTTPQGCWPSRPSAPAVNNDGAVEPPPVARLHASHSSLRNLNTPSMRPASVPSSRGSIISPGRPQAAATPSSTAQPASNIRPNRNLTPIPAGQRSTLPNTLASPTTATSRQRVKPLPDSSSQAWTQRRLDQERADWWDTRVTGSSEVWACLRIATGALQQGDVATAQTLLDAQECTCPDGQLWSNIYDHAGNLYRIPEWLIIELDGIVEEATDDKTDFAESANEQTLGSDREYIVRARLSSTAQDVQIPVRRQETIASIRERLKKHAQVRPYIGCMLLEAAKSEPIRTIHTTNLSCQKIPYIQECADKLSWTQIKDFGLYTAGESTQTTKL